jgi:Na+/H+ antiporter NhaD/arsenite permease-like protein
MTEKLNRAIAALSGAILTYFVLIFIENLNFSVIVDLLFGSSKDDYVNLHSLILIIAMMMIVSICHEAGVFQFFAIKLIILSKGKPIRLLIINCTITVLISAVLNNILTVIILIPLTITISRILNTDPSPYILTQAILVNIGGTIFSISSIPNILITTYAKISFNEFFINVGVISLIIFVFTIILFIFLYKSELKIPEEGAKVLKEFNVWNLVQNKRLLYESMGILTILIVLLISVPSYIISADMIALTLSLILIIISKLEPKEIIAKIDFELIFYLLGIFIIAGALEIIGITELLGMLLLNISGDNFLIQILIILWFSAFLSSSIDNIPITKVLIPVIGTMSENGNPENKNLFFYSLAIGANWGDNLTPLGDNILVMNIAEHNKRPITFKQFFKLGFITTIYQLAIVSVILILLYEFIFGMFLSMTILLIVLLLYSVNKFAPQKIRTKINNVNNTLKNAIIK